MTDQLETDWRVLVPGEVVTIEGTDPPVKVTVWPVGLSQLAKFKDEVALIFGAVRQVGFDPNADAGEIGKAIVAAAFEVLIEKGLKLLSACCKPPIDGAPPFVVAPVAESWIRQSFAGDRAKNYSAPLKTLANLAGHPSLSEWLSRVSSRPAIAPTPSSENASADPTAAEPLTAVGLSPNSAIG